MVTFRRRRAVVFADVTDTGDHLARHRRTGESVATSCISIQAARKVLETGLLSWMGQGHRGPGVLRAMGTPAPPPEERCSPLSTVTEN
jgi:hypothetical protein